jgi:hypothetical protein
MFTVAENEIPLSVAPVIVKSTPALLYTPSPEYVPTDAAAAATVPACTFAAAFASKDAKLLLQLLLLLL